MTMLTRPGNRGHANGRQKKVRRGGTSCLRVQGKASVFVGTVGGKNKREKAQVSGFVDSEQRTLWTSNSSLQVHPHLCVLLSSGLQTAPQMCVREERQTGSVLAPPHSSRQAVHLSLPLSRHHPRPLLHLSFFRLLSVGSISKGAGAAQREQVAAFKVVKARESRKKRAGRGGNVCVCVCVKV